MVHRNFAVSVMLTTEDQSFQTVLWPHETWLYSVLVIDNNKYRALFCIFLETNKHQYHKSGIVSRTLSLVLYLEHLDCVKALEAVFYEHLQTKSENWLNVDVCTQLN